MGPLAFKKFYQTHKDQLFGYLMRMTGDYYLAADLMQETFTRYLEHYGNKKESVPLLFTIARNAYLDYARRETRRQPLETDPTDKNPSQEKTVMVRQEYQRVLSAMQRLDPMEKEILSLAVSSKLTYRQIASITNTSEGNIKVKIHRARVKLKQFLEQGVHQ